MMLCNQQVGRLCAESKLFDYVSEHLQQWSCHGCANIERRLWAVGASSKCRGLNGCNLIMMAVCQLNEQPELAMSWIKALHRQGLSIDDQDDFGETALIKAVRLGAISLVVGLLELGANPDIPNKFGEFPETFADQSIKVILKSVELTQSPVTSAMNECLLSTETVFKLYEILALIEECNTTTLLPIAHELQCVIERVLVEGDITAASYQLAEVLFQKCLAHGVSLKDLSFIVSSNQPLLWSLSEFSRILSSHKQDSGKSSVVKCFAGHDGAVSSRRLGGQFLKAS